MSGPLEEYRLSLLTRIQRELEKQPYSVTPVLARHLAEWIVLRKKDKWDAELKMLVQLAPSDIVVRLILRRWFPPPHKIYKTTVYARWLAGRPIDGKRLPSTGWRLWPKRQDGR